MHTTTTVLGQVDGLSGHLVAVDCDGISRWNTAAHGPLARQVAATATGGPVDFDGVRALTWSARGPVWVRGQEAGKGWIHIDLVTVAAPPEPKPGPALGQLPVGPRLFVGDLAALGAWAPGESIDGKADLSFSGRDAAYLAQQGQVPDLGGGRYGWTDLPGPHLAQWKTWVEQQVARGVSVDIVHQPHDLRHSAEALIQASPLRAGIVQVRRGACVVLDAGHPHGAYPAQALLDASGQVCGVRIRFQASPVASLPASSSPAPPLPAAPQAVPPDPMTATKNAMKSAAVDHAQSAATKAAWRKVKSMLPRWAWPLLPDGKRDFVTRAKAMGQEKLIGMVAGCLFTGCLLLFMAGIVASVGLYVVYELVQSL